jgi:cytosine/adenosine deaminase-related metal-dependent hydrolase
LITLAIVNARVWTGNPQKPWATAIAVEGDKVIAVASSAEVAKLVTDSTTVIDAKGKTIRNPAGNIERGGGADFVMLAAGADHLEPDQAASNVVLQMSGGEIIVNKTA